MRARHQRLVLLATGLGALTVSVWLVLSALKKNMVFFFTPTQVVAGEAPSQRRFRLGGLVEGGSVQRQGDGVTVQFTVTDMAQRLPVRYRGALPDLFKEGKGVVVQGRLLPDQVFVADEVLAKHDENYMPPEAAYALKKASADGKTAGLPQ
jgi:cytochrome c-type biogenesis protein CcmE